VVALYQERLKALNDFVEQTRFFFSDEVDYDPQAVDKVLKKDHVADVLREARSVVDGLDTFEPEALEAGLRDVAARLDVGFKKVAQPLRVALTGGTASAGLFEVMSLLGKETVTKRLDAIAATLV